MKKISLKNLILDDTEVLSREELKEVLGGYTEGSGGGSGGTNCGENEVYDTFRGCICKPGYYFSGPFGKCVEGNGSGGYDPNPKLTACNGKVEGDSCDYYWEGKYYGGNLYCRYRFGYLSCSDTFFK